LSYTPARAQTLFGHLASVKLAACPAKSARVADAKEVGVGNPAEETCCHPN